MTTSWQSRLNNVVNALVILAAIGLIGAGPVKRRLLEHRARHKERVAIQTVWTELVQAPRAYGKESARRVLVAFGDYQCPACRDAHGKLGHIADELGAKLIYRHVPITAVHPKAELAARAAICAEQQGDFVLMHNHLYENDSWMEGNTDWINMASLVGVKDSIAFDQCLSSESTKDRLARDRKLAIALSIRATPTYAGALGMISGNAGVEELRRIVK